MILIFFSIMFPFIYFFFKKGIFSYWKMHKWELTSPTTDPACRFYFSSASKCFWSLNSKPGLNTVTSNQNKRRRSRHERSSLGSNVKLPLMQMWTQERQWTPTTIKKKPPGILTLHNVKAGFTRHSSSDTVFALNCHNLEKSHRNI